MLFSEYLENRHISISGLAQASLEGSYAIIIAEYTHVHTMMHGSTSVLESLNMTESNEQESETPRQQRSTWARIQRMTVKCEKPNKNINE